VTASKFFYVCAGLFLLALSYHFGASTATATVSGAGLVVPTEVAALSGVLLDGETIPLPTYADGTVASETECNWTVSAAVGNTNANPSWCYAADAQYSTGLPPDFLAAHRGRIVNITPIGQSYAQPTIANYLIIATRASGGPTPALRESWGQVKSRYAPSHAPTSQTPTNR
jgi:hypothetical protein